MTFFTKYHLALMEVKVKNMLILHYVFVQNDIYNINISKLCGEWSLNLFDYSSIFRFFYLQKSFFILLIYNCFKFILKSRLYGCNFDYQIQYTCRLFLW